MSRADGPTGASDDRRVVLFDLDGVLTSKDTFATLVARRLRRSPWRLVGALPALPLMAATGRWPRWRGPFSRYLVRMALFGMTPEQARESTTDLGRDFARNPHWLNEDGIRAARRHVADGDRVVVVTATERSLARALLDELGLADVEVLASGLSGAPGGVRLRPHNYGSQKVSTLRANHVPEPWALLYTDSWADAPLMRSVDRVVLIGAGPGLLRRARKLPATATTVARSRC